MLTFLAFFVTAMLRAQTVAGIRGSQFTINGEATYSPAEGFPEADPSVRGTLLNVRAVQAVFDDANYPRGGSNAHPYHSVVLGPVVFDYPDEPFSATRNVSEFLAALPAWRKAGVLAFTINLQGGGPVDGNYGPGDGDQPQANSGFDHHGRLKPAYASRLKQVIAEADRLHMIVIVGLFYFGSEHLVDQAPEDACTREAIREASSFLKNLPDRNVMIEIANEVSMRHYHHPMLKAEGIGEAVHLAQQSADKRIPVSFSWTGPLPSPGSAADAAFRQADFVMFHTNGKTPEEVSETIDRFRSRFGNDRPLLINEDGVSAPNLQAAVEKHVGWGYYDQGLNNYRDGFQSPPVDWQIDTVAKWVFFEQVARLTGSSRPPRPSVPQQPATIELTGLTKGGRVRDLAGLGVHIVSRDPKWPVKRVEFFVDDIPYSYCQAAKCSVGTPFPWRGPVSQGKHTLRVVSYIRRGPAFSELAAMVEVPIVLVK